MQVKKVEAESIFNKLCVKIKSTKHHVSGWIVQNGQKILPVYYSHGKGDMPGKVGDKFRQSFKINEDQFKDLRDCPLSRDGYIGILVRQASLTHLPR